MQNAHELPKEVRPFTPYETLDEVKKEIDKFDERCLDLLDVLDKLKPAGIDPNYINSFASEIIHTLQRLAPEARERIECRKEVSSNLDNAPEPLSPPKWQFLCRRYQGTIRHIGIQHIPALFEVVPPEHATLLDESQVFMERAGTGRFHVQQLNDDCGIINRMHMLGPHNDGGENTDDGDGSSGDGGRTSGDGDGTSGDGEGNNVNAHESTANTNTVHLTWAASGAPTQPGGRVHVEFVPYDQTHPIVSLEVNDNKEMPRVMRTNSEDAGGMGDVGGMDGAGSRQNETHPSRTKLIKQVIRAKTLDRQYEAMCSLASFHVSNLASHLGLDRKEVSDFVQEGVNAWYVAEVEGRVREMMARQEEIGEQVDEFPPADMGPMPHGLTPLEDMVTKVSLAQSLQGRHAAQIELLNALAGDLVRYCALDGQLFAVLLKGWMRKLLSSSSRSILGLSSRSMPGPSSKAVEGISLPKGTKWRPVPMSVLRRRAGPPALPNPPSTRTTKPPAPANNLADIEMSAAAASSMAPSAASAMPAPATPATPALFTPARPDPSTPEATPSSPTKKRKRTSDANDAPTLTRQLRSSTRAPSMTPSPLRSELPSEGPSTVHTGKRTQATVSATLAQSRSTAARSRVIPAKDRIYTMRARLTPAQLQPYPKNAFASSTHAEDPSTSMARAEDIDDQDGEPQSKRRRSARFGRGVPLKRAASHRDTRPVVDVAGQTTNSRPPRRLPFTTTDRPQQTRPRSASTGLSGVHSSAFLLPPASSFTSVSPSSTSPSPTPRTTFVVPKSNSIPLIAPANHLRARVPYPAVPCMSPSSDDDDERTDDDVIYTAWASGQAHAAKPITTAPGQLGAGETETEADEPPRRLPTARIVGSSAPIVPPSSLQQQLTPLLFEFSRLLSIVPAFIGLLYNIYHMLYPPSHPGAPQRVDYFVSALWAILTGYQCLSLTTGLLTRWRIYYAPLSTLIRLLALQSICWPATHFTLVILEHEKRPVITWAVIATTTCCSRSVQLWVTSNLWWEPRERMARGGGGKWHRWRGGQWGGRRWDWREVGLKCMFPAGVLYFVMAWAEQLRREFSGC
ncbi:uncharacterized protein SCHCODRAFT_02544956 [Schizophyllum commune H4-8]|nr:uncharacterized protein SCHCODRAFT_02544956 [Schizophyllum commune H4-8]KAI5891543.1 hypothetical protein SCHCODRAFT_02544956 [Schizophyllum commune H4-8]